MKALVLLALAALLVGCGSASYSKQDFVARANAICAGAVRQTRSILAPGSSGAPGQLSGYVSEAVPIVRAEARQLHALEAPPGSANDRELLSSYLRALDRAVADYEGLARAAKRGDAQGVADAEAALQASPVAALAARYGLRSCGTPTGTKA